MLWLAIILAIVAGGYGLHRLALWAEGRGWIYYRTKRRPGGVGLSLIGQIYQPSIEHVVETEQSARIEADRDESGDPPSED